MPKFFITLFCEEKSCKNFMRLSENFVDDFYVAKCLIKIDLIGIDGPIGPVAVRIYFCEGLFKDFI